MGETNAMPIHDGEQKPKKCYRIVKVTTKDGERFECKKYHEYGEPQYDSYEAAMAEGEAWLEAYELEPWENRMVWEYEALIDRLDGLKKILDNIDAGDVDFKPECSQEELCDQFAGMCAYKAAMEQRTDFKRLAETGNVEIKEIN